MKKFVFCGVLLAFLMLSGAGILAFASQEETTESINKSWTLTAQTINDIYVGGTNQPVNLIVEQTEQPETIVRVSGKVPERSLESLENPDYTVATDQKLQLAFERWNSGIGTSHININEEKREKVTISVALGKNTSLKDFHLDNMGGDITITVPKNLAITYKLNTHESGKIKNGATSSAQASTLVEVHNYGGNITVKER